MHFVITAIGSEGDINPLLAIASELKDRGHDIDFIANEYFQNRITSRGLKLTSLGHLSDYERALKDPRMWEAKTGFSAVWNFLKDAVLENYRIIEKLRRDDTHLIGTTLAFGARLAQEKLGISLTSIHLAPCCIISAEDIAAFPGVSFLKKAPLPLKKLYTMALDKFILDPVVKDDINALRSQIGLEPVSSIMVKWIHSPDQVICTVPDWFAKKQPDWPPNSMCLGFPLRDHSGLASETSLPQVLEEFIEAGPSPVVFTAGSANAHSREYFSAALNCATKSGIRAVFVSKFAHQVPDLVSENLKHIEYAPFRALFPRCSAIVHHGGIGTSMEAMLAGKPQMILPFGHDQYDNAYRLKQLGVADYTDHFDGTLLSKKLRKLTNSKETATKCSALKELMYSEYSSIENIANAIEQCAKR